MNHQVTTEQKLQLVRNIRMQNQYNRQTCREREQFLYGSFPEAGELHSMESASCASVPETSLPAGKTGFFTSFRIRFLVALILLSSFIYMDKTGSSLFGIDTGGIFVSLTESIPFPDELPARISFPPSLK